MGKIIVGKKVVGRDKKTFIKEMSELWDVFEKEGLCNILGFEYFVGEPIKIKKVLKK